MTYRKPIIAIDGPVGAGKSTTARKVAQKLGFLYIDTGAMYRAITLDVLEHGVDPNDEVGVCRVIRTSNVELKTGKSPSGGFRGLLIKGENTENRGQRTFLNGRDVSDRIRERDVTVAVSAVSAMGCVRELMTEIQRETGKNGGIVMEGRDIGTVVFPNAEFKIYLDASVEVRAKRRYEELSAKGTAVSYHDLLKEIKERDRANIMRELAPLRKADDAILIDTTDLTFDQQVHKIISIVRGSRGVLQYAPTMVRNNSESMRFSYLCARYIMFFILKVLYRISVKGVENIPRSGGVIIASNHASWADPPCVGTAIPREVTFFAKKELFKIPVVRQLIKYVNTIAVDRRGYSRSALKEVIKRLKDGWAVLFFPEGTRTKTGEFLEPKSGAGMVAVMADVPIVPCWVEGSFRVKLVFSKITVHFLPPFNPSEIEAKSRKEHYLLVSERIMYDISKLYKTHMARRDEAKSK